MAQPSARAIAWGAGSFGALALGGFAAGAVAVGALAIGSLAVRRLWVTDAKIDKLHIRRFVVEELQILRKDPPFA